MRSPRRLRLAEFQTEAAVRLSPRERDALRRIHPGLRMEPTPGWTDRYNLTPDQHIGLVALPSLTLEIRPKIPVSSVLFLISYSCDAVRWQERQADLEDADDIVDMVAILLARAVERATRRGLLTVYHSTEEPLRAPRGKILFAEHVRRRLAIAPPIDVQHDEFTADVLENQILLAALTTLGRAPLRSRAAQRELQRALRAFGGVSHVRFAPHAVPDIAFNRLNRHYEPAIMLASLVLRSASVDLGSGSTRGGAFLLDMNRAFEAFVRAALRHALNLPQRDFPDRVPHFRLDDAERVVLKPDLCLRKSGHILWVGDAKYKSLAAGDHRNSDIYQVLAYTIALGLRSGTLIYAAAGASHTNDYVVSRAGKRLRVFAIDLSAAPARLLAQIRTIVDRDIVSSAKAGAVSPAP